MSQSVMALRVVSGLHLQQLRRVADGLVIAVAVSLPWSTSATSTLVVLWLLAVLPTLSFAELRAALHTLHVTDTVPTFADKPSALIGTW